MTIALPHRLHFAIPRLEFAALAPLTSSVHICPLMHLVLFGVYKVLVQLFLVIETLIVLRMLQFVLLRDQNRPRAPLDAQLTIIARTGPLHLFVMLVVQVLVCQMMDNLSALETKIAPLINLCVVPHSVAVVVLTMIVSVGLEPSVLREEVVWYQSVTQMTIARPPLLLFARTLEVLQHSVLVARRLLTVMLGLTLTVSVTSVKLSKFAILTMIVRGVLQFVRTQELH
jgi:hypothetical protein